MNEIIGLDMISSKHTERKKKCSVYWTLSADEVLTKVKIEIVFLFLLSF